MKLLPAIKVKLSLKRRLLQNASVIAINTATDSSAILSLASASLSLPVSNTAAGINIGRAALCLTTRFATECKNAGYDLPLPQRFKEFAANKGASFRASATITYLSAAFAAAGANPAEPSTYIPAIALAAFGSISLGFASSIDAPKGSLKQNIINAATMTAVNTAHYIAIDAERPLGLIVPFALSASSSIALAVKNSSPKGLYQPLYYTSLGCLINSSLSFANDSPHYGYANLIFSLAFLTLDKLKKHGGIAQAMGIHPANDDTSHTTKPKTLEMN